MRWAFDLFDESDVRANANVILERLERGDMPCDQAWTPASIARFGQWMNLGDP